MGSELTAGQRALLERHTRRGGPGECWPWCGPAAKGRPLLRVAENGSEPKLSAAKVVYQLHGGPVPAGRYVLQSCGNRLCLNPAHLYLSTTPVAPPPPAAPTAGAADLAGQMARLTRADVPALDAEIAALDARRAALSYLRSYAQSRPVQAVEPVAKPPAKKPAPKKPTGSPLARRMTFFVAAQGATSVGVLAKAMASTPGLVFAAMKDCPWLTRNGDTITATPAGVALALEGSQ